VGATKVQARGTVVLAASLNWASILIDTADGGPGESLIAEAL